MIFCEKQYAEDLLKYGFTGFMSQRDLNILARYFKSIGKNKKQIRSDLIEFCKKYNQGFNEFLFETQIRRAIDSSQKYKIREHIEISISEKEMDIIRAVKNFNKEKILFVMISIAKYFKFNHVGQEKQSPHFYVNAKFSQIAKMARVNISKKERNQILFDLNESGLIETNLFGAFKINFVDNENEEIIIKDMNNIISFFPIFCSSCNKKMDKKLPRHDMCKECYQEKRRNDIKNNVRKFRVIK